MELSVDYSVIACYTLIIFYWIRDPGMHQQLIEVYNVGSVRIGFMSAYPFVALFISRRVMVLVPE